MTEGRIIRGVKADVKEGCPWVFVQLADSQLGMLNMATAPDEWGEEARNLGVAVEKINFMCPRPSFVVVCGDLVNEFPKHDPDRAARQVADFKRIVKGIDASIPLVCVCGNHDVGDVPTRQSVGLWTSRFGVDYGEFRVGDTRCLVLNSQLYSAKEEGDHEMASEQDEWLDAIANDDHSATNAIIFSHIPPFIYDEHEPKGYFNFRPDIRKDLLDTTKRIRAKRKTFFCGHFHRNAGAWTTDRSIEVVVTSAVGTTLGWSKTRTSLEDRLGLAGIDWTYRSCDAHASGLRCVCVHPRLGIRHKWFALNDIPHTFDLASDVPGPDHHVASWDGEPPPLPP
ncbi:hypothetical protein CTAYLR_006566 [Chrysophaeum taylorii]|uniref:Calcineurin-like phosphoesterase domain-containing protein n=1 Tax=Chrysophaeum taylorii TaxID=2483200 RepID=A0AAD7UFH5_9STRA|nr:hypothetical protein CTAYLR_006566 [Chrysophaeum taylorii]